MTQMVAEELSTDSISLTMPKAGKKFMPHVFKKAQINISDHIICVSEDMPWSQRIVAFAVGYFLGYTCLDSFVFTHFTVAYAEILLLTLPIFIAAGVSTSRFTLVIDGEREICEVKQRLCGIPFRSRSFEMNEYLITRGYRPFRFNKSSESWSFLRAVASFFFGVFGSLIIGAFSSNDRLSKKRNNYSVCLSQGPHGETWHVLMLETRAETDRILEAIQKIIPQHVVFPDE
jgi:hypothetical protein